ncbi:MAG: 50S ribosomal protein L29 [Patescibacteria group bacterium]|nr:MAG: 50S ribosomal protein L29 [Patescibacteria group bacterium]
MELQDLRKKELSDLHKLLGEKREDLRRLRFKDANKQLKDVREVRELRLLVARLLTVINEKR